VYNKQSQCPLQYRFKISEGSPEGIRRLWRKGFVKEMSKVWSERLRESW